jgi:tetratricopeptide (TPR) repeat protein
MTRIRRTLLFVVLAASMPALLAQAPPQDPREEFDTAFDFARRFFEAGDFPAALTFFENADGFIRDQPAVLFNTALVLVRLGRYDQAQQRLDRYLQLHSQSPHTDAVKKLQREIQFAVEVEKRERQDSEYRLAFNRARLLNGKGLPKESLDAFRDAERLNPSDPPLLFNMAALYEAGGDLERAVPLYKRYVATSPPNRSEVEQKLFDLESEIVDKRTRIMCPFCGEKLPAGAHWCHRCWHGPYDDDGVSLDARACEARTAVTRTASDITGKVRERETLGCLYPGSSMRDLVQYGGQRQHATWKQRESEGWGRDAGTIVSYARAGTPVLRLDQTTRLSAVELLPAGEVLPFTSHQTPDGIWLLDREPYAVADQRFDKTYTYDDESRIASEKVTYESAQCRHVVAFTASYAYGEYGLTSAVIRGGYDGYQVEGAPHVQWEATVSRTFDPAGRLGKEELLIVSHQKTWLAKPSGPIGAEVRPIYTAGLKPKRPTDIRAIGDLCGRSGAERLAEPIDLRALYTLSPALAMRVAPGVTRVAVDYVYPAQ